jgi:hypothetical protein
MGADVADPDRQDDVATRRRAPRLLVLSSHSRPSVPGPVNHRAYCVRHGYPYLFDATPYELRTPYDQKLVSVLSKLERTNVEWLF